MNARGMNAVGANALAWLRPVRDWLDSPFCAAQRREPPMIGMAQRQGDRAEQQDRVAIFRSPDNQRLLAVAADGLGGLRNGAAAAGLAVAAFERAWASPPATYGEAGPWLRAACLAAHADILRFNHDAGAESGSTIAAAYATPRWAAWLHVGDTRIYLMRRKRLARRTRDHSLAELLAASGGAAPADRNTLTQCLGAGTTPKPALDGAEMKPGDGLILASDGVWGQAPESFMTQAFQRRDLQAAADFLADSAVDAAMGRSDNASVVFVRV